MPTTATQKPLSDLMYDWLTVLQNKAEGAAAYEKYIQDAESANATECTAMLRKLQEQDTRLLEEVRDHVFKMIVKYHSGK